MLVLSRVCADFRNHAGQSIFSITPPDLLSFLDAPESIQEDPLFAMLIADGSLEAVHSVSQQRSLESDPAGDTNAEGRKPLPEETVSADAPSGEKAAGSSEPAEPAAASHPAARVGRKSAGK